MLQRSSRVRADRDYRRIFRTTRPLRGRYLSLRVAPAVAECTRFGFVVGKKVEKRATARNLLKRRLRSLVRRLELPTKPVDCVIIANPGSAAANFSQLSAELLQLWNTIFYASRSR